MRPSRLGALLGLLALAILACSLPTFSSELSKPITPLAPSAVVAPLQQAFAAPGTPDVQVSAGAPEVEAAGTPQAAQAAAGAQTQAAPAAVSGPAAAARHAEALARELTAPESLAEISLEPEPGRVYTPSPEDWRAESIYSLMLDRFARGPHAQPQGDPKDGRSRHGGDIQGVIDKLDYLNASGITTILLSPVTQAMAEAVEYHGYGPVHLMAVDPRLGTMTDLKRLVAEAHARGMRVVLDMVLNHAGSVFEYKDGNGFSRNGQKEIDHWNVDLKPVELAKPEHFTRRGVIDDWDNGEQLSHGDFPPYYHRWATERPETQKLLVDIAKWWLKETDVDGFRIDAVSHMDQGFLRRFNSEIRSYAASLGKSNFLLFGEHSTGIYQKIKDSLGLGFDTLYNYPAYRRDNHALHGQAPAMDLETAERLAKSSLGDATDRLVRFIDLQDVYRFLREGEPLARLMMALGFLLLSTGIPLIFYGTEQAFRHSVTNLEASDGKADPENRQDMFPEGQFKSASSAGDKFDENSPIFQWLSQLNDLRGDYPALAKGQPWPRWADANGPGIYAFSRIHDGQELLVVTNTAGETRSAEMWVDAALTPPGTLLVNVLDAEQEISAYAADGGSKVRIDIPANGTAVFVPPLTSHREQPRPTRVERKVVKLSSRRVEAIEQAARKALGRAAIPFVWLKYVPDHIEVAFGSIQDAADWQDRLPLKLGGFEVRLESNQADHLIGFKDAQRVEALERSAWDSLRQAGIPAVWLKYKPTSVEPERIEVAFGSVQDAARWEERLPSEIDGVRVRLEANQADHVIQFRAQPAAPSAS